MDLGTGVAVASLAIAGVGTFFLWRQTNVALLKEENDTLRKDKEDLQRQLRDCWVRNHWLEDLARGPKPNRS